MREPLPLHRDSAAPEDVRRDLADVRELPAPPFAFDRGLERLRASIAQPAAERARPRGLGRGAWGVAASIVIIGLGAGFALRGKGTTTSTGAPPPPVSVHGSSEAPRVTPEAEAAPAEAPAAPSSVVHEAPLARPPAAEAPSRPAREDRVHEELAHMRKLRAIAASDPSAALALAEEGQRRFGSGVFPQEREVIAIDALRRLGHSDDAKLRAQRFLEAHPESPFADKVRHLADLAP